MCDSSCGKCGNAAVESCGKPAAERKGPCAYSAFGAVEPPKTLEARLDEQFGQMGSLVRNSINLVDAALGVDAASGAVVTDDKSVAFPAYPTAVGASALDPKGVHAILQQRGSRYGSFKSNADVSQSLKTALQQGDVWSDLSNEHREALEYICGKLARIVNGGGSHDDNWVDICGYAELARQCASEE